MKYKNIDIPVFQFLKEIQKHGLLELHNPIYIHKNIGKIFKKIPLLPDYFEDHQDSEKMNRIFNFAFLTKGKEKNYADFFVNEMCRILDYHDFGLNK